MSNKLVSVIVPVYNTEVYLDKCVQSIVNQTYQDLEIILVNDGSLDRSGKICDIWAEKDARIRVIHKQNGGLSDARNCGLDQAVGDYIGFVDSDDYIEKDMYASLVSVLEANNADIACTGIIWEDMNGSFEIIRCPKQQTIYRDGEIYREIFRSGHVGSSLCSKLFVRNAFDNIRMPVGETNEDLAIAPALYNGKTLVHTGVASYHYKRHQMSITTTYNPKNAWITIKNAEKFETVLGERYPDLRKVLEIYKAEALLGVLQIYEGQKMVKDENIAYYYKQFADNRKKLLTQTKCSYGTKIKIALISVRLYRPVIFTIRFGKSMWRKIRELGH